LITISKDRIMQFIGFMLISFSSLLAIPTGLFFLEIVAAVTQRHGAKPVASTARSRVTILVPAHNEGAGLLPTIGDLKPQLRSGDRLLVVADNCTDDTASIAAAAGVEVVERHDREKIGKGYALDWGLRHLVADPPDVVVMVDADCRLADGAIDRLA